jgi:hypothetical protein
MGEFANNSVLGNRYKQKMSRPLVKIDTGYGCHMYAFGPVQTEYEQQPKYQRIYQGNPEPNELVFEGKSVRIVNPDREKTEDSSNKSIIIYGKGFQVISGKETTVVNFTPVVRERRNSAPASLTRVLPPTSPVVATATDHTVATSPAIITPLASPLAAGSELTPEPTLPAAVQVIGDPWTKPNADYFSERFELPDDKRGFDEEWGYFYGTPYSGEINPYEIIDYYYQTVNGKYYLCFIQQNIRNGRYYTNFQVYDGRYDDFRKISDVEGEALTKGTNRPFGDDNQPFVTEQKLSGLWFRYYHYSGVTDGFFSELIENPEASTIASEDRVEEDGDAVSDADDAANDITSDGEAEAEKARQQAAEAEKARQQAAEAEKARQQAAEAEKARARVEIRSATNRNPVLFENHGNSCYINAMIMLLSRIYWKETCPPSDNETTNKVDRYMYILMNDINSSIEETAKEEYKSFVSYYTKSTKTQGKQGDPIDVLNFITSRSSYNLDLLKKLRILFIDDSVDYIIFYDGEFMLITERSTFSEFVLVSFDQKTSEVKYLGEEKRFGNNNYTLVGAIKHIGTDNSGHYTVALRLNDGWFLYNDLSTAVPKIDNIQNYINGSRLFLYERQRKPKAVNVKTEAEEALHDTRHAVKAKADKKAEVDRQAAEAEKAQRDARQEADKNAHQMLANDQQSLNNKLRQAKDNSNTQIAKNTKVIPESDGNFNEAKYQEFLRQFTIQRNKSLMRKVSVEDMLKQIPKSLNATFHQQAGETLEAINKETILWESVMMSVNYAIENKRRIIRTINEESRQAEDQMKLSEPKFSALEQSFKNIMKQKGSTINDDLLKMIDKAKEEDLLIAWKDASRDDSGDERSSTPSTQIRELRPEISESVPVVDASDDKDNENDYDEDYHEEEYDEDDENDYDEDYHEEDYDVYDEEDENGYDEDDSVSGYSAVQRLDRSKSPKANRDRMEIRNNTRESKISRGKVVDSKPKNRNIVRSRRISVISSTRT